MLKQLKASIGAREKIGVVGRTGAGKSSLMRRRQLRCRTLAKLGPEGQRFCLLAPAYMCVRV